jgi:hypothetical protein
MLASTAIAVIKCTSMSVSKALLYSILRNGDQSEKVDVAADKSSADDPGGQRGEGCMKAIPNTGSVPRFGELPVSKKSSWPGEPMAANGGYSRTAAEKQRSVELGSLNRI